VFGGSVLPPDFSGFQISSHYLRSIDRIITILTALDSSRLAYLSDNL
jgi:hypothetical protein